MSPDVGRPNAEVDDIVRAAQFATGQRVAVQRQDLPPLARSFSLAPDPPGLVELAPAILAAVGSVKQRGEPSGSGLFLDPGGSRARSCRCAVPARGGRPDGVASAASTSLAQIIGGW